MAAHLMTPSKKGMSALKLTCVTDISYEPAWFLFRRLPKATNAVPTVSRAWEGVVSSRRDGTSRQWAICASSPSWSLLPGG